MGEPAKVRKPTDEVRAARESAPSILSNNLVKIREAKGYEREKVARMMGKADITLLTWEQGSRMPTVRDLMALASIYDVTPDVFFEPTPHCSNCNIYYSDSDVFCSRCGLKLQ